MIVTAVPLLHNAEWGTDAGTPRPGAKVLSLLEQAGSAIIPSLGGSNYKGDRMSGLFSLIADLFWLAFWIVLIVAIIAAFQFNGLRQLKETVNRRRANVGAALKKRADIMNRAAEALKGYQGYEQFTTLKISQDNTAGIPPRLTL